MNNNPGADASTVCHGSGHVVYVTVRGGIYSKIAIWTAVGAAVLGACAAEVATGIPTCELAWELGEMGGKGATSNIPDAKTAIWASEVAPDSDVILRGLTTSVKVLHVKREDFNRKCNASTEGQVCYKDNDDRGTCRKGLCNRN